MAMTIFFNILFMLSKEKTFMKCRMQILLYSTVRTGFDLNPK